MVTGHVILYALHSVLDVAPVPANIASTVMNTAIVLWANRTWVWNQSGTVRVRGELVPFFAMAAIGLAVSTLLVWATAEVIGEGLWVNAANFAGFGLVWFSRFLFLDQVIYGSAGRDTPASPGQAPSNSTNAPTV